jgi:hypothetical protein
MYDRSHVPGPPPPEGVPERVAARHKNLYIADKFDIFSEPEYTGHLKFTRIGESLRKP